MGATTVFLNSTSNGSNKRKRCFLSVFSASRLFRTFALARHGSLSTSRPRRRCVLRTPKPTTSRCPRKRPQARQHLPAHRGQCRVLSGTCSEPAVGVRNSGWRQQARSIFSNAAEPGHCHVRPWLDRSDLHQLQMASITSQNTCNSGTSRWRADSVAFGKIPLLIIRMREVKSNKRSGHGPCHPLDHHATNAKAGALLCAVLQSTYHAALMGICL